MLFCYGISLDFQQAEAMCNIGTKISRNIEKSFRYFLFQKWNGNCFCWL